MAASAAEVEGMEEEDDVMVVVVVVATFCILAVVTAPMGCPGRRGPGAGVGAGTEEEDGEAAATTEEGAVEEGWERGRRRGVEMRAGAGAGGPGRVREGQWWSIRALRGCNRDIGGV